MGKNGSVRRIDTGFALSFRSPEVQGIIRAANFAVNAIVMDWAIIMNRATIACRAELLLFFRFLANGLVRCQDFVPIFIALLHRIHFTLVLRAIRMSRLAAKTLGAVLGGEI